MIKKLPIEEFKRIYSKVPRICIDLVINSEKGVLLCLRDIHPAKGFWHLPGGSILYSETIKQAAERIGKEELGVDISVIKLLGFTEILDKKITLGGHSINLTFLVGIKGQIKLDRQSSKFDFFKKLPPKTLAEHKKFILSQKLAENGK